MLDAGGGGGAIDRMPDMPTVPWIGIGKAVGEAVHAVKTHAGHSSGGGYTFTPEEIDNVLRQWEDLRDGLLEDEEEARTVAGVKGPGTEFASGDFEQAAGPSGDALLLQTERMRIYVEQYIEALKKAKDATQARDEDAAATAQDAGGML